MKSLISIGIVVLGLLGMVGCSDSEDEVAPSNTSEVELSLKTTYTYALDPLNPTLGLPLSILQINIGEITFDFDDDSEGSEEDSHISSSPDQFEGPFLIDLLSTESFSGQVIGTADVPNGLFEQLELGFEQYQEVTAPDVVGYSIFGKGTFQGNPIVIKSDRVGSVDVNWADNTPQTLSGEALKVRVDFDLDKLVEYLMSAGATTVKDGDNNGIYEISTDGTDGNEVLANSLVDALENAFELTVETAD